MKRMMGLGLFALAISAQVGLAGCGHGGAVEHGPERCPAGEVVVESGTEVPCDLVGGVNTLTEYDVDLAYCDAHGGTWTADEVAGTCRGEDF